MPTPAHARIPALFSFIFSILLLFSGCAAQLAPGYDKAVVDGLNSINAESMTLFASTANGTQSADFNSRATQYASVIGKLDALAILAAARPMPKNRTSEAINAALAKGGISSVNDDGNTLPSVTAVQKISDTLAKMRDTDQKRNISALEVSAFKGQVSIYLAQAITYENFLQR